MSYEAIIFDFFDVIHRDPFQQWLKQNNLERDGKLHESSKLLDIGDIDNAEFFRRVSEWGGRPAHEIQEVYDDTSIVNTEMLDLIKSIKTGYKTGLLSNSSIEYIWSIINRHQIEPLFDVITVSAEVRLIKPEPAIFKHILAKLGVAADTAVFIDDNPKNVAAASDLGIRGIVYKNTEDLKKDLSELDIQF